MQLQKRKEKGFMQKLKPLRIKELTNTKKLTKAKVNNLGFFI
jgi:hypothetical protein